MQLWIHEVIREDAHLLYDFYSQAEREMFRLLLGVNISIMLGGYIGYWMRERVKGKTYWMTDYYMYYTPFDEKREFTQEDRRFNAGLVGGLGLIYLINEHWGLNLDALYYYDLVSHHRGYAHLRDPRYLSTLSVTFGGYYQF